MNFFFIYFHPKMSKSIKLCWKIWYRYMYIIQYFCSYVIYKCKCKCKVFICHEFKTFIYIGISQIIIKTIQDNINPDSFYVFVYLCRYIYYILHWDWSITAIGVKNGFNSTILTIKIISTPILVNLRAVLKQSDNGSWTIFTRIWLVQNLHYLFPINLSHSFNSETE